VGAEEDHCPPTPDGQPLTIKIPCSTRRSDVGGSLNRHEVVIEANWQVRVPHDLLAERVAVALGGFLTCVELVDRALPAARELFGLVQRCRFPELRRRGDRFWVPARPAEGCCRGSSVRYSGPAEAAVHLRGVPHAAAAYDTESRLVSAVFAAVMQAHGYDRDAPFPETETSQATACVPSVRDVQLLWLAGVAPRHVATVHRALGTPGRPLPVNFYLGLVTRRPDLAWVANGFGPDHPDGLSACSGPDLEGEVPGAPADLLSARLPGPLMKDLASAGYVSEDIELLVSATRRSSMSIALTLRAWVAAGCRPSASELVGLYDAGVSPYWLPRAAAVARLRESVGSARPSIPDNQLGFLLGVCGCVPLALAWVRAGHRDALMVAGALAAGLGPHDTPSAGKATDAHAL
jgi:hypothetical protein